MFTLDFLIGVLVVWGISKIIRAMTTPSVPKPPVGRSVHSARPTDPLPANKIVDATFEELE